MTTIIHDVVNEIEFDVFQLKLLKDNFSYVISAGGDAIVIDPSLGDPILKILDEHDLELKACLITHHHPDHAKGIMALKKEKDCLVIGPTHPDLDNVIDQDATDGDELIIGSFTIQVISTPGHTLDHLFYYFPDCLLLFTGDTLFLSGCGKMFEGDERQYYHSLQKIKALPPKIRIFCGHDCIKENSAFAKEVDPSNPNIHLDDCATVRFLEEELKINPFLKAKNAEEFLKLRKRRDTFRDHP